MLQQIVKSLILFLISLSFTSAYGKVAKKPLDLSIDQSYRSIRAMAMGGAFAAVVDDHSALFYNPAALARRTDGSIRMFLGAGLSDNFLKLSDDIDKIDSGDTNQDIDDLTALLEANYGEYYHLSFPKLGAIWVRPNWGVAILPIDGNVNVNINRQVGPSLLVNAYFDTTLAYGYARDVNWFNKIAKGQLSVGVTGKAVHRVYGGTTISAAQAASGDSEFFNEDDAAEGLTFDADVGMLWTPELPSSGLLSWLSLAKPSFAFVVRNLLDYGFSTNLNLISDDSLEAPKMQRRIDLGSKWDLPNFWVFDPHLAIDVRDMLHENWSLRKGIHIGAELYWTMFSWWKGHWAVGINQGYLTAGIGAKLGIFQLDVASYGEEVGTTDDPKENRRYLLEMSLDF